MYQPSTKPLLSQAPGSFGVPNMLAPKLNEAPQVTKAPGEATHMTGHANLASEPTRPQDMSRSQNRMISETPTVMGGDEAPSLMKNVLKGNDRGNCTTESTASSTRTLPRLPTLQTKTGNQGFAAKPSGPYSFIGTLGTPPFKGHQAVDPQMGLPATEFSSAVTTVTTIYPSGRKTWREHIESSHGMVAKGRSTKSISQISQDNAVNAQHRHTFHFEQQSDSSITTMYTNNTSKRASSHVRDPIPKTFDAFPNQLPIAADTTFIPRDLGAVSSKRKTWEQDDPLAPKDIRNSTKDQPSPQIEAVKEAGELPTPKRQKRNSIPHVVMAQDSHSSRTLKPHTTPPTITVVSDIVSYEAVRLPTATMPFTGGGLSFSDARLSCVLPQNFDYNFDKIVEAAEVDGMLKFDVSWEPVFVSFAQIRGEAEAVAELITHLPSLAVSVERSATVPETAMAFSIEAFKSWEIVLRDGLETLLLEVCFPNSGVEFKDLKGVHTMNYARNLVTDTFGKIRGNQLLRTQPSK
ncbi:hypothetical protein PG990_014661 [Apiospora arundinis]